MTALNDVRLMLVESATRLFADHVDDRLTGRANLRSGLVAGAGVAVRKLETAIGLATAAAVVFDRATGRFVPFGHERSKLDEATIELDELITESANFGHVSSLSFLLRFGDEGTDSVELFHDLHIDTSKLIDRHADTRAPAVKLADGTLRSGR